MRLSKDFPRQNTNLCTVGSESINSSQYPFYRRLFLSLDAQLIQLIVGISQVTAKIYSDYFHLFLDNDFQNQVNG